MDVTTEGELGGHPGRRHPPDRSAIQSAGIPEIAIRPHRDPLRLRERRECTKRGDLPLRRDPADLVGSPLGKPDIAVGSSRDTPGFYVRNREYGDGSGRRDTQDFISITRCDPEI